jgi:hypothetical protein
MNIGKGTFSPKSDFDFLMISTGYPINGDIWGRCVGRLVDRDRRLCHD